MRTPRSSAEHQEAVSRRLALLSAELGSVTGGRDGVERGGRESAPDLPAEVGQVAGSRIPTPGRHASRRRQASTGGPAPGSVLARMSLGAAQLSVLAVALALGLGVTGWWLLRATPSEVPPSAGGPAAGLVTPVGATDQPAPSGSPVTLVVDVAGKVRRPGIAVLDPGARVVDAIRAAGGARPGVDLSSLNLARVLVDGEQILVGVPAPQGVAATATGAGPTSGALVNLNTADQIELETLPEVGPVTAQAIIGWREEHGGFSAVDQLLDVDGIGAATLSRIAPMVTL